jgi:uncharacterized protein (DUF4415 family)
MTANAKSTRNADGRRKPLPTLDDVDKGLVTLDDYEVAHRQDVPELTETDFASARPIADFPELQAMFDRARGQRGPQKAPVKERVGLRLDKEVVEHFRKSGPGWQSRINEVLVGFVRNDR